MKVIGATPASSTEVYTGVQQGTMDAASFPFTYSHVAYKIHEVTEWFVEPIAGNVDCRSCLRSTPIKTSRPVPKLLMDVREDVINAQIQAYIDIGKKSADAESEAERGEFSDAELAKFRAAASKPVIDKWIAENQGKFDAKGVINTIFAAIGRKY